MRAARRWLGIAVLAFAPLWLAACQDPAHQPVVGVQNRLPDLRFSLQSADKPVTERDVAGRIALVFFGYANCPDVCPTTMAHLTQVRRSLGPAGDDVRILFISVDPHRDTPEMLAAYVRAFDDEQALGLAGTPRQIQDLARRYRVSFQISEPANPGDTNYEVSHSKGVFVFDRKGAARYLVTDIDAPGSTSELARVLGQLAAET
ncbi:SCO family protein [Verticiella sediminum]|uniref:SCO family protein n=1 Tax=Verticiella sediminum TaxID=1247510 RepID=A0A556ABF9_9BURK|nr:SCO family protein [Verticiella sediminum]